MFKLIGNENTKIYRRLRTWILLGVILIGIVLIGVVMKNHQHADPNWKQSLVTQTAAKQQEVAQSIARHEPPIAVKQLQQQISTNQYYINHNIDPNQHTAWNFALTADNLAGLLVAFIVVVAGDIVASEFASGTIKMLLTQTVTRSQILLSKYLATLLYGLFMTVAMLVLSVVVGGIFFGFGGAGAPQPYVDASGVATQMSTIGQLLMSYGFLYIQIIFTATIAFMISTIFRSSALAITISILAYLIGNTLVGALSSYSWVKYILFANTNLTQYVVGGPMIKGMTLGFSITMLIVYFVVMMALSWTIFLKRDVAYT